MLKMWYDSVLVTVLLYPISIHKGQNRRIMKFHDTSILAIMNGNNDKDLFFCCT